MARNARVQVFNDGKPKPGGKLLPDPFFLAVKITICPYCKKVYRGDRCDCKRSN